MFGRTALGLNFIVKRYAGHSKWANIKHIKEAKDSQRNVLFTKLSRQIKVAVADGGSIDPSKNLKLSQIIQHCKRMNMPVATIQSVLKSCSNDKSNSKLYTFDIKGPGNCIVLFELFTGNLHPVKNSIGSILRKCQSKYFEGHGLHAFEEKGFITAENSELSSKSKEDQLELATEHAIECNAEEVDLIEDNVYQFLCSKEKFINTQDLLEKSGYKIINASVDYIPIKMQKLTEAEVEVFQKLISKLEEIPEVVRVFDNVSPE